MYFRIYYTHLYYTYRKYKAALYAHNLALRNLEKPEILHTCISFMEILGIDSENLRLHITVANYIYKQINIPIGNYVYWIFIRIDNHRSSIYFLINRKFTRKYNIQK